MSEGPSWAHRDAVRAAPTFRVVDAPEGTQVSTVSLGELISINDRKRKQPSLSAKQSSHSRPANTLGPSHLSSRLHPTSSRQPPSAALGHTDLAPGRLSSGLHPGIFSVLSRSLSLSLWSVG